MKWIGRIAPAQSYSRNKAGFCRRIHRRRAMNPPPASIPIAAIMSTMFRSGDGADG